MSPKEMHERILQAEKEGAEAADRGEDPGYTDFGSSFGGFWSSVDGINNLGDRLSDLWDRFKNGESNTTGKEIADENLAYERERSAIEDERYADETAYNRAWAENEREYNRALQQTLFDREDTAIERQAASLASLGINPASVNMNGLGAGQQVSSAVAPTSSTRSTNPLHNDFRINDVGILTALGPLATLANSINQVATGVGQSDLLQSQIEKQNLENFILAKENGILPYKYKDFNYLQGQNIGSGLFNRQNTKFNLEALSMNQDIKFKYRPEFARTIDYLLSDDFLQSAEKALTKGANLFDKGLNSDTKSINPFKKILELFW